MKFETNNWVGYSFNKGSKSLEQEYMHFWLYLILTLLTLTSLGVNSFE